MKRSRFSDEQIAYAVRMADGGTPVVEVCRQIGIWVATFYTWKKKYGELGVSELAAWMQARFKVSVRRSCQLALLRGKPQKPTGPNQHRSKDFVHDQTHGGRAFRLPTVIDRWSRESVCLEANFRLSGRCVAQALDEAAKHRG